MNELARHLASCLHSYRVIQAIETGRWRLWYAYSLRRDLRGGSIPLSPGSALGLRYLKQLGCTPAITADDPNPWSPPERLYGRGYRLFKMKRPTEAVRGFDTVWYCWVEVP